MKYLEILVAIRLAPCSAFVLGYHPYPTSPIYVVDSPANIDEAATNFKRALAVAVHVVKARTKQEVDQSVVARMYKDSSKAVRHLAVMLAPNSAGLIGRGRHDLQQPMDIPCLVNLHEALVTANAVVDVVKAE